jgi:hypothetical protein
LHKSVKGSSFDLSSFSFAGISSSEELSGDFRVAQTNSEKAVMLTPVFAPGVLHIPIFGTLLRYTPANQEYCMPSYYASFSVMIDTVSIG